MQVEIKFTIRTRSKMKKIWNSKAPRLTWLLSMILLSVLFSAITPSAEADNGTQKAYLTPSKPLIDGTIDSLFYQGTKFDSFKQIEPSILADAVGRTEIYFLYDAENIYIAGNLYQDRNTIKASAGRRDAAVVTEGDLVVLALDPLNNGNSAHFFTINPANGVADGVLIGSAFDYKWDGIFHSATKVYDDHWTFEFQLPISSVNFQSKDDQTWGVMFQRIYSLLQEKSANSIADKDNPLRVDVFQKIDGLRNLKQRNSLQAIPYVFSSYNQDLIADKSKADIKFGGELKFKPVSSMSIIATINPDFAQIETDAVIVNVNDVPVSLPERRPFFTESSDLYPGLAVNTRNIGDINAGIKLRQVVKNLKYDATWVQDKERNNWLLSNARWTNNKTFHAEVISGIKNNSDGTHYNVTTNLRGWALNRRLTFYNWAGTINRPGHKNEFETVNSVQWVTREVLAGFWSHVKSAYYNPNVTGHNTLSNEIIYSGWLTYTYFTQNKAIRRMTADFKAERKTLYTTHDTEYYILYPRFNSLLHISDRIGNWEINFSYRPPVNNFFRYRNIQDLAPSDIQEDAYGRFALVSQNRGGVSVTFTSDYSKKTGISLHYNNFEIRKSSSNNARADMYWKVSSKANLTYSIEMLALAGSLYQSPFNQAFHRLKTEYNITNRLNIRGIVQLNTVSIPTDTGIEERVPLLNLTASWQYSNGSYVYLLLNKYSASKKAIGQAEFTPLANEQLIGIKINKTFNLR